MGNKIGNTEFGDQKFGVYYITTEEKKLVCSFDDEQEASSYANGLNITRGAREDISEEEKNMVSYAVIKIIARQAISAKGIYTGIDWHKLEDNSNQTGEDNGN